MGYWKNWQIRQANGDFADTDNNAAKLGGEVEGKWIRCPSPGRPPEDRSCFVGIPSSGRPFIYDCEGSKRAAYQMVLEALDLPDLRPQKNRSEIAQAIWDETISAAGTNGERYLYRRGITLPVPGCIRYHPMLRHPMGYWPAMVAARTNSDGSLVAIHRTFLSGAAKAQIDPARMDLGPMKGTAIRLAPLAEELVIGEGIETTLSVMQVERCAGWAAGSAVALRLLVLPPDVRSIIVLADGDDAGRSASQYAAERWRREGRRVRIAYAPDGKDFNDLLQEPAR